MNHRPVFGISSLELKDALQTLGQKTKDGSVVMNRDRLLSILQNKGLFSLD